MGETTEMGGDGAADRDALREGSSSELRRWTACILLGILAFFAFAFFYLRAGYLYDADSYVHLAVSRLYGEEGLVRGLPWPRFSVMHDQYGDKELMFHLSLMPLVMTTDPAVAGRVMLAIYDALLVTLLAMLFTRHLGWVGLAVPWWLLAASPPFLNRVIRLRPEILGLVLFLLAAALFIRKRWVLLGFVAFLYPLSYTAFHVLFGLVVIWTVLEWLREKTLEWKPVVSTAAGILAGNLIHPHPIDHLKIWWLQNVSYFSLKGVVEVEEEILPPSWQEVIFVNGGWWLLALAVLALILWRHRRFPIGREAIVYGSTALLFSALYLKMGRMVLYAMPFLALTLTAVLKIGNEASAPNAAAGATGKRSDPGSEPSAPEAAALFGPVWGVTLGVVMLIGVPIGLMFDMRLEFFDRTVKGLPVSSEAELEQFGRSMPSGARVAADWDDTQLYAFWAPQGRYLNMYDPLFMAVDSPEAYRALRAIFNGEVDDIPPVMTRTLQSEFLAIQTPWDQEALNRILDGDPRWRVRHRGANLLLELIQPENGRFLTQWDVVNQEGIEGRVRGGDPWGGMVHPPADGCHRFETDIDCRSCALDMRAIGMARLSLDGERVRDIDSKAAISPWTTIEHVEAKHATVEYCGPAGGGFFLFRRRE